MSEPTTSYSALLTEYVDWIFNRTAVQLVAVLVNIAAAVGHALRIIDPAWLWTGSRTGDMVVHGGLALFLVVTTVMKKRAEVSD